MNTMEYISLLVAHHRATRVCMGNVGPRILFNIVLRPI